MRVTFSYCNLACYVYENMSIYMYNQVNRSQFPNSDQLQSCSNNNFNYTPSTRIASFDEVITKGKKLWSFSNSINYALRNCEISLEKLHMVTGAWRVILSLNKPQYYMHFLFSPLPTSYCNLSEKSCSFNIPFHMMIVNMTVANKSYSKGFVIRVLGPCGSLTLTELIC